jgi:hypothetical protein
MNEGQSRLMTMRTLPPFPDLDLTAGSDNEWECSSKKKSNK